MRATASATGANMSRSTRGPATFPARTTCPAARTSTRAGRLLPNRRTPAAVLEVGVGEGAEVVCYCGSGVTACHNLLAIEHAGLGIGRLYPGSWSQYSQVAAQSERSLPDPTVEFDRHAGRSGVPER